MSSSMASAIVSLLLIVQAERYIIRAHDAVNVVQTIAVEAPVCNQDLPTSGSYGAFGITNPTGVLWDDPLNTGKVCWYEASGRVFPLLPAGTYTVSVAYEVNGVEGPPSQRASFVVTPPEVTGVRLRK